MIAIDICRLARRVLNENAASPSASAWPVRRPAEAVALAQEARQRERRHGRLAARASR